MPDKSFYLDSYSRYLNIWLDPSRTSNYDFIAHDNYNLPNREETSVYKFVFLLMAEDFTRELINAINKFGLYMDHLDIWSSIFSSCDKQNEQIALLTEFIDPIAFLCLNKPYSLRSQFIYATTYLLDMSNSRKSSCWTNQPVVYGQHINHRILEPKGKDWKKFSLFSDALNAIDNKEFRNNTRDFRNKSHHAIPPELEFGITSSVRRTETKSRKISFEIGGIAPLKVKDMCSQLRQQHQACVNTFSHYWELMEEQLELWNGHDGIQPPP